MTGALQRSDQQPLKGLVTGVSNWSPEPGLLQSQIQRWVFEAALPWWAANTWDETNGGVVEVFDFNGRDAGAPFKRTRVACRQIYVFSHAHMLGWPHGLELAGRCVRHLTDTLWRGKQLGFPRLMTRAGEVADPTIDLYDHAFALFGFAWHTRATGSAHSRDWMYRTLDFVESKFRYPDKLGFMHQLPMEGARLQNPHMHLAEACLVAFETTGDNRFRDIGKEMVDLCCTRFCDSGSGALYEFFKDDLQPIDGRDGARVEPGHQFEWCWILNAWRPYLSKDVSSTIKSLQAHAERYGVDPGSGAVRNAVAIDGAILDGGSRTWPNTERVKAALARYELDGQDPAPVISSSLGLLFDRYLDGQGAGRWRDSFDARGEPTASDVPTSTLYHLMLALTETLRVLPKL